MAQGRMLSRSVATDPDFNQMSTQAQLLFIKAIPHLDRDGLITGHLSRLWATIDPFHADTLSQMGRYIQEWVDANLVIRYDTGREPVLFFTGFRKNNQAIKYDRESESLFPPPPGWTRSEHGLIPNDEDERGLLAYQFNSQTRYQQVLLRDLPENADAPKTRRTHSGTAPDTVRTGAGVSPPENKLSMYDGDDVSYILPSHPASVEKRGVRGESAHNLVNFPAFPDHVLREAAWVYGELLYPGQWHGYQQYLLDLAPDGVIMLIEWIKHFMDATQTEIEEIHSLPKMIKWHINRLNRPSLNLKQRKELITMVSDIARNPQPDRWA